MLNLSAANDVVSVLKLNPPYNLIVDLETVPSCRSIETLFETRPLDEILADMAIGWNVIRKEALTPVLEGAYNSDYEL